MGSRYVTFPTTVSPQFPKAMLPGVWWKGASSKLSGVKVDDEICGGGVWQNSVGSMNSAHGLAGYVLPDPFKHPALPYFNVARRAVEEK